MAWGSLALAILKGVAALLAWLRERQLLKAGEEQAITKVLKGQLDAIEQADKAREEAYARNAAVPKSSSLPDDGFRRD